MGKVLSSVMEGSLLIKRGLLARNPVLAAAKAAGRATRVGQNSALAMVRGTVRAARWTKQRVACSAKLLNPFNWAPGVQEFRSSGVQEFSSSRAANSSNDVRPRTSSGIPTPELPNSLTPKLLRAVPPEVTPAEACAAVFAGVTEKVMFARALTDLASQNQATRARAARILGGIPHELSAKALSARLARDPSAEVRKECVNGLTALGMKEALPAVERALSDKCGTVRLAAVRGIYRLAGAEGAALLVRMFSDEHEDVQRRAAVCLGWLGQGHLAVELLPLLQGESASVRLAALEALGNLKSSAVVHHVIELLDDPEQPVQRKAFEVLRTITGKQMGKTFPEDEKGRLFLIARWRAWRRENPLGRES